MENLFPYVIAIVVVIAIVAIMVFIAGRKGRTVEANGKKDESVKRLKNRNQIIRDSTKKLSSDPHNPDALISLGDLYFNEHLWDQAFPLYDTMSKISGVHPEIDPFLASLRSGICAIKLNKIPEAMAAFSIAYKKNPHDFDVNFYVGQTFFSSKEYEKAIPCLKKALIIKPDAEGIYYKLGQCYYETHHYHESLPCLKKALDEDPQNKEALYDMADAMTEEGYGDKALKVFMHLRPDPVFGARSCLAAGMIHDKNNSNDLAVQDYLIGLKHPDTPNELKLEIQYRLALSYFAMNDVSDGLQYLRAVQLVNPSYKDVATLVVRYQELSQNKNLQVFLVSGTSDFIALCRKIVIKIHSESNVKIQNINVGPIFSDILASIENNKWEDVEVFRFFRTTGSTGELYVRDFHASLHDLKADRGVCITAGTFTDEARKFVEGRPIDLIEKTLLIKILKTVD